MTSFNFKRQQKLTEERALKLLEENGYLSTAMIQHKFGVGYAEAARMIDVLAEKRYIHHNGQRWVKAK